MSVEELILISLIREEVNKYTVATNEEANNIVQELFTICVDEIAVERVCSEWLNKKGYHPFNNPFRI